MTSLAYSESIKTGAKWQAACVSIFTDFQSLESCIKQFFIFADKCIIILVNIYRFSKFRILHKAVFYRRG